MTTHVCKICGNAQNNKPFTAREMMFGFRDEFEYFECSACGCLQISEIPPNITRYYPENYYSYQTKGEGHYVRQSLLKRAKRTFKKHTLDYYLSNAGLMGKAVAAKFSSYYPWLKTGTLTSNSSILDVGCGSGELLLRMYNDGFTDLTGADPYIREEIKYACGVRVHKKHIWELEEKYDLVMLHHAFEHMAAPEEVLQQIYDRLKPGGQVIIRIPVAGSYAWRTYGVDWVQLDAPRHFFLHTEQSINLLASRVGFRVSDVVYDSYDLQFVGSEKYKRGLALVEDDGIFTPEELIGFREKAVRLNETGEGDSACFYLDKLPR